jgi:poly(A) polymerase
MGAKTVETAVVIVPPRELWGPIESYRRRYDRHQARWMPHLALIYPFRPREEFAEAEALVLQACAATAPFAITLARLGVFPYTDRSSTLWVAPDPPGPVSALQQALQRVFPDCDDVARHPDGFTPHLCLGQTFGPRQVDERLAELRAAWKPLSFQVRELSLLARTGDTPFTVVRTVRLGMRAVAI